MQKIASTSSKKRRIGPILDILRELYPEVASELVTSNPYEKVVATILSAQCTDKRVNMVTPALFERFPDVDSLADAQPGEVESFIHSTGFYHNKAKHLIGMAKTARERFGGEIPGTMESLLELPGVARKTANCVLNDCFGIADGIVVDTHVDRLARRLGLTNAPRGNAVRIERDLMELVPKQEWIGISHRLIYHGRRVCDARKPACGACALALLCPSAQGPLSS